MGEAGELGAGEGSGLGELGAGEGSGLGEGGGCGEGDEVLGDGDGWEGEGGAWGEGEGEGEGEGGRHAVPAMSPQLVFAAVAAALGPHMPGLPTRDLCRGTQQVLFSPAITVACRPPTRPPARLPARRPMGEGVDGGEAG
jgi:hypothetical protein